MNGREQFERYWCDKYDCSGDDYWFESGSYGDDDMQMGWETWQVATAQAVPQVEDKGYLVVNFGYGAIEVAEGISEDTYALILGNNGGGVVGADLQGNRHMTKQETLAVLKFHSLAAIEVVITRLDVLRKRMKNNEPVEIKNSDGEVIKVVNIKLQAAQEDK